MKRPTFPRKLIFAGAFLAALILSGQPQARAQDAAAPAPEKAAPAQAASHRDKGESVDQRIENLRKQMAITPEQEPEWKNLAQTMQDNAASMKAFFEKWKNAAHNELNALDNLKFHAEMADIQSQALHKLVTAFEALYNKMPDAQKKIADDVFSYRHSFKHKKGGMGRHHHMKETQENQEQ